MMCRCSALPGWDNSRARVCESSLKSGWPRSTPCQATVALPGSAPKRRSVKRNNPFRHSTFVISRDRWGRRRLAAAGRSAPDDDQVSASKGDPLPFGQVAPTKDVLAVGVDGDLDRLG